MKKILLALAYWEGDRKQAEKLAQFISDMEPKHSDQADFLLVSRFDSGHSADVVKHISRKFNTFTYKSGRRGTGWPAGCNSTFEGTMEWVYSYTESRKLPAYKAVLTFEADCCPLTKNWISRLHEQWDFVNKDPEKPVYVAGPLVPAPEPHINGNCLISGNVQWLKWLVFKSGIPGNCGWDFYLRKPFERAGWANIPGMKSLYNTYGYKEDVWNRLRARDVFFVHGCKDSSLMDLTRKNA
jgi:hypothetical protein